jgi:hypothetical protein
MLQNGLIRQVINSSAGVQFGIDNAIPEIAQATIESKKNV